MSETNSEQNTESKTDVKIVTVFTDGSAIGNSRDSYSGWAVYFPEYKHLRSGCRKGTNNGAEFQAVIHALWKANNFIKMRNSRLIIYSDSEYVIKILQGYNIPKKNLDLVGLCRQNMKKLKENNNVIEFKHVMAHTGKQDEISIGNDIVDKQARMEAVLMKKRAEDPNSSIIHIVEGVNWNKFVNKDQEIMEKTYILCSNYVSAIFYGSVPWLAKIYTLFSNRVITINNMFKNNCYQIKASPQERKEVPIPVATTEKLDAKTDPDSSKQEQDTEFEEITVNKTSEESTKEKKKKSKKPTCQIFYYRYNKIDEIANMLEQGFSQKKSGFKKNEKK